MLFSDYINFDFLYFRIEIVEKSMHSLFFFFLQECRDECESGMQLASEGECELCPRGTYRTRGVEPACHNCPVGRTTPKGGAATIEECSLPICLPGTVIDFIRYWLKL